MSFIPNEQKLFLNQVNLSLWASMAVCIITSFTQSTTNCYLACVTNYKLPIFSDTLVYCLVMSETEGVSTGWGFQSGFVEWESTNTINVHHVKNLHT